MFVKIWISDLVVAMSVGAPAGALAATYVQTKGIGGVLLGLAYFLPIYMLVAPFCYRWFRLRPVYYPACPRCAASDGPWWTTSKNIKRAPATKEQLVCGQCRAPVEFWYARPLQSEITSTMPVFELKWPQNIGRWSLIRACAAQPVVQADGLEVVSGSDVSH